jgi:pimeloyl-ACP methyl ester carboxylesterase
MKSSVVRNVLPVGEMMLHCADGLQLAAQVYKTSGGGTVESTTPVHRRILCLHGWMDNCRSFHHFAPSLLNTLHPEDDTPSPSIFTELVALDLPGHGWSSHKSADGPPVLLADSIFYVAEAVRQLQWFDPSDVVPENGSNVTPPPPQTFTLVGHSMGAAISCLYAAAFPEQIDKLVLLEGGTLLCKESCLVQVYFY